MSISKELKKLYKTITKKDAKSRTIDRIISELNENYPEGGGSSLPDMTGQNGKFLTTNGTAASWGAIPKEAFVAHLTPVNLTTGTLDVDYAEIKAALYQEKVVCVKVGDSMFYAMRDDGHKIYATSVFNPSQSIGNTIVMVEMENGETECDVNFVITPFSKKEPHIVHMTVDLSAGTASTTDGKTIADIIAVAAANPFVYAEFAVGTGYGRLQLCGWDDDTAQGEKTVTFGGVSVGAKGVCIYGENDGTSDTFTVTAES